jgi:hypothetical protein
VPKPSDNLLGRIALACNIVNREQLEECRQIQQQSANPCSLGEILLDRGWLSREQLERILDLRRKKLKKLLRTQNESRESDLEFAERALRLGVVDLDELEAGMLELEGLRAINLHFSLCEVLISRGRVDRGAMLEVLRQNEQRMLRCPACDWHYRMLKFQEGEQYGCSRCGANLVASVVLDSLVADEAVDSQSSALAAREELVGQE